MATHALYVEASMTRLEWLDAFAKELQVLRPHLGESFARSVAANNVQALGHRYDPQIAALEYHLRESLLVRPW